MKNLAGALLIFHQEIGKITKDETNPFFKSKYASLSNILEAIKDPLEKSKLVFMQIPTGENELRTVLVHTESGESVEGTAKMLLSKQDPQGQGSAITYMRRYALSAILGLNIEDDDGNYASGNVKPKQAYQQKSAFQPQPQYQQPQPTGQPSNQLECHECGNIIDSAVFNYSKVKFGKPLCRDCQKKPA